MNRGDVDRWRSDVLDEILMALAADDEIEQCLVFKGARILNARLGGGRQSLDLDSNLTHRFVEQHPDREDQRSLLERSIKRAITRRFEGRNPVRYELDGIGVKSHPANPHPMGWDAFKITLHVDDLTKSGVRGLPGIVVDVAAPEELLATSISAVAIGTTQAQGYTLERIAGEKMRAFLSSLPACRRKFKRPGKAVRAKDLYDLARIYHAYPLLHKSFWDTVGREFRVACRSRYIDCLGLDSFTERWNITEQTYHADLTIPEDIDIVEARSVLETVVGFLHAAAVIPFEHPLPG